MMKPEKKIRQKKISTRVNFSSSWSKPLDHKHHRWENLEAQSLVNQTVNDKTREKKLHEMIHRKKKVIKTMRVKIDIKYKLEGNPESLIEELNWKQK